MATFTVDLAADKVANDGKLSLREAVARANATAEHDSIRFASFLEGKTLTLTRGELLLTRDVTIDGDRDTDGKEVTLSGGGHTRILNIVGEGTEVGLDQLTLTRGSAANANGDDANGGAIQADGLTSLRLHQVVVAGNSATGSGGGIFSFGEVKISRSIINDNNAMHNGGGIYGNSLELTQSIIRDNDSGIYGFDISRGRGGGIFCLLGTVTLNDCTVSGNTTIYGGGGIFGQSSEVILVDSSVYNNRCAGYGAYGGGVGSTNRVMLQNTTVSGNEASQEDSQGGGVAGYLVSLVNCTITGNSIGYAFEERGAGVFARQLTMANSIVAGNPMQGDKTDDVVGVIATSNGHNIFGGDAVGAIIGDLQGISPGVLFASIDPDSGGGQISGTGIVPLRNSVTNPALSGGDPLAALPTDQIGAARPLPAGSLPDIGAAERNQALSAMPSPNNDVLIGTSTGQTISAGAGADLVLGLAGNDTLRGEGGSDLLDGGSGNDLLDGGAGINLARFGGSSAVAIDLVAGTAKRVAETDTLSSIQGAIGSSVADRFTGDGDPNWFQGGGGRDLATGGAGRDLYDLDRVQDSLPGAANRDVIGDLAPQSDRIDLTGIDADTTLPGNQAFRFVDQTPLTGPGQLGYRVSGGDTILRASTDADGMPELEIQLTSLTGIGGYVFYL